MRCLGENITNREFGRSIKNTWIVLRYREKPEKPESDGYSDQLEMFNGFPFSLIALGFSSQPWKDENYTQLM